MYIQIDWIDRFCGNFWIDRYFRILSGTRTLKAPVHFSEIPCITNKMYLILNKMEDEGEGLIIPDMYHMKEGLSEVLQV